MEPAERLSHKAKNRLPSAIRSLYPLEKAEGMVSVLSGKPNAATFPFKRMTLELDDVNGSQVLEIQGQALQAALQYGPTAGLPELVEWIEDFQSALHGKSRGTEWRSSVGVGSQDLLNKALEALLNEGDCILVEDPVYTGILPGLHNLQITPTQIPSDGEGMLPDALQKTLDEWHTSISTKNLPFPRVMYLTPTGANPSGATSGLERRKAIFDLVKKYDILLIEDDAYYFLHFDGLEDRELSASTRSRLKTYWSLDVENRYVLRLDSFSKVLSAGLRLGYVTGPSALVGAIDVDTSSRNLQSSGVSQAVALSLLQHFGIKGFLEHADRVARFYLDRLNLFEAAAVKYLAPAPTAATWIRPSAGMFLWLRLSLPDDDSLEVISQDAIKAGILALPGIAFSSDKGGKSQYVRACFSLLPEAQFDEFFQRLRKVIDQRWSAKGAMRS